MIRRLIAAAIVLGLLVPAVARAETRLLGLDATRLLFDSGAGPDRLVAGDLIVAASPGEVYGWPVTGGKPRRLGKLPELGEATNDIPDGGGFVRVEAAQPGRVVVVRGAGRALDEGEPTEPGHHLVVGPPRGPFVDPAGCGERTGGPAGLSGDLLAYVAAPATDPPCAAGATPATNGAAVVVRDLAQGAAVTRVISLRFDGAVAALRFDGPFVALELRRAPEDPERERPPGRDLAVYDVRTGAETSRVRIPGGQVWDLGPDGTLIRGRPSIGDTVQTCIARLDRVRLHGPGDTAGRALAVRPCGYPAPELRAGGRLRLALPRRDGRVRIVDRPLDGPADRLLATVAGPLIGGDDRRLVVADPTCRTLDARVISLDAPPASPAGSLVCPIRVRTSRVVRSGDQVVVRVSCPRGCRASVDFQVFRPTDGVTSGYGPVTVALGPGRSRNVRFRLERRAAVSRNSSARVEVFAPGPVESRLVRRRIVIRPR